MTVALVLSVILAISFAGAVVPLGPTEIYLAVTISTNHLGLGWALGAATCAALGQISGKLVVFQFARRSTHRPSRLTARLDRIAFLRSLRTSDEKHPRRLACLVVASSLTGLPPFTVVAPLAGAGGIRRRVFFACGMAGRLTRFAMIAIPVALS